MVPRRARAPPRSRSLSCPLPRPAPPHPHPSTHAAARTLARLPGVSARALPARAAHPMPEIDKRPPPPPPPAPRHLLTPPPPPPPPPTPEPSRRPSSLASRGSSSARGKISLVPPWMGALAGGTPLSSAPPDHSPNGHPPRGRFFFSMGGRGCQECGCLCGESRAPGTHREYPINVLRKTHGSTLKLSVSVPFILFTYCLSSRSVFPPICCLPSFPHVLPEPRLRRSRSRLPGMPASRQVSLNSLLFSLRSIVSFLLAALLLFPRFLSLRKSFPFFPFAYFLYPRQRPPFPLFAPFLVIFSSPVF